MTRIRLAVLSGGLLLAAAQVANAQFSAAVGLFSDYDFRGVSLSADDPAVQASVDYAHDAFYASIWGSNIDYGDDVDGDIEIDLIAGFAGENEAGLRWDLGGVYYMYPDSDESEIKSEIEDYPELYAGTGAGMFDAKLWYTWDSSGSSDQAYYLEGAFNFPLPLDFGLTLHAGLSFGEYYDNIEKEVGADPSYMDFSVALTRSFQHFDFELKGVSTSTESEFDVKDGPFVNDNRIILSVSTTFPWSDEE